MKQELCFDLSTAIYPMEAVYGACYVFTDRAFVEIEPNGGQQVRVRLKGKGAEADAALESLTGEFKNELLHQAFRHKISSANQKIREYIVTRALLSAQNQPQGGADGCPAPADAGPSDDALAEEIKKLLAEVEKKADQEDPFGLTAPWEEKTGEEKAP